MGMMDDLLVEPYGEMTRKAKIQDIGIPGPAC